MPWRDPRGARNKDHRVGPGAFDEDVLDRILHPDFDPRRGYALTLADGELTEVERIARTATTPDDVQLEAVSRG